MGSPALARNGADVVGVDFPLPRSQPLGHWQPSWGRLRPCSTKTPDGMPGWFVPYLGRDPIYIALMVIETAPNLCYQSGYQNKSLWQTIRETINVVH
jgi:hypothetical protein